MTQQQPARPARFSRPARVRAISALAGAVAGGLVASLVMVVAPAQAQLAIPVDCSTHNPVLRLDHAAYDLRGTCGVVRIEADGAEVSMPAATRLVVEGHGNTVTARPVTQLVVRGHHNAVATPSVHHLRLASPGSTVRADGLVETARLRGRDSTLRARQVSDLLVRGRRHHVTARRGYDARLPGDRSRVTFRRLDALHVAGDRNRVRVRRGETRVRVSGDGNRVRVRARG